MFDDHGSSPWLDGILFLMVLLVARSQFVPAATLSISARLAAVSGFAATAAKYLATVAFRLAVFFFLWALHTAVDQLASLLQAHVALHRLVLASLGKKIKAQIKALNAAERHANLKITALVALIDDLDAASTQLMKEIRAAERIVGKKIRFLETEPARVSHHKYGGLVIVADDQKPCAPSSCWAFVCWWRGEVVPTVYDAQCSLAVASARLATRLSAYYRAERDYHHLVGVWDRLEAKKQDVEGLSDWTFWAPLAKTKKQIEAARRREGNGPHYQPPTRDDCWQWRYETAQRNQGLMHQVCYECPGALGWGCHPWQNRYQDAVSAANAPVALPCPAARARLAVAAPVATIAWRVPAPLPVGPLFSEKDGASAQSQVVAPAAVVDMAPVGLAASEPVASPVLAPALVLATANCSSAVVEPPKPKPKPKPTTAATATATEPPKPKPKPSLSFAPEQSAPMKQRVAVPPRRRVVAMPMAIDFLSGGPAAAAATTSPTEAELWAEWTNEEKREDNEGRRKKKKAE